MIFLKIFRDLNVDPKDFIPRPIVENKKVVWEKNQNLTHKLAIGNLYYFLMQRG